MKCVLSLFAILSFWLPLTAQEPIGNRKTIGGHDDDRKPVIVFQYIGRPSFRIHVNQDRTLVYEGTQYVKTRGKVVARVSDGQFQQLLSAFQSARFFSLRRVYNFESGCTAGGSEGPWISLTLRKGKRIKTVDHDLGCDWGGKRFRQDMNRLLQLEKRIDEILNIEQWIGTESERNRLPNPLARPPKGL